MKTGKKIIEALRQDWPKRELAMPTTYFCHLIQFDPGGSWTALIGAALCPHFQRFLRWIETNGRETKSKASHLTLFSMHTLLMSVNIADPDLNSFMQIAD